MFQRGTHLRFVTLLRQSHKLEPKMGPVELRDNGGLRTVNWEWQSKISPRVRKTDTFFVFSLFRVKNLSLRNDRSGIVCAQALECSCIVVGVYEDRCSTRLIRHHALRHRRTLFKIDMSLEDRPESSLGSRHRRASSMRLETKRETMQSGNRCIRRHVPLARLYVNR